MAQPVYDHKPINRLTQVTTTLNLAPMAPRKTLISKKPAKKAVEEEIVDEEEAEEIVVEADSKAEPEDDADDAEEQDEEADGDDDDDADDEDKEEDIKPKKGKKSAAEPKKQREVSSAMPKIMVDAVFANLKEAGEVSTTKKEIKAICDCFIKTLVAQVMDGEKITLTNHMTFKRAHRKERVHKAPKSGIEVTKPEHYVMTMEVKPDLKKKFFGIKVVEEEPKKKETKKAPAKKETKPAVKEAKKAKK